MSSVIGCRVWAFVVRETTVRLTQLLVTLLIGVCFNAATQSKVTQGNAVKHAVGTLRNIVRPCSKDFEQV